MLGNFTQHMTIMGTVVSVDPSGATPSFTLKTRGGDVVKATIAEDTFFQVLRNLDGLDRDRFAAPVDSQAQGLGAKLAKYAIPGRLIAAEGIYQVHGGREWFDVKRVHVLHSHTGYAPLRAHSLVDHPDQHDGKQVAG